MAVVGSGSRGVPVPSYAAAGAAFAEAVAYLSSRDAQQMSESDLERELHRLGQELMDKLLQGHREQRDSLAEAAGPVERTDEVDVIELSQRRVPEGPPQTTTSATVQVARQTHSSVAPRRRSTLATAAVCDGDLTVWYCTSSSNWRTPGRATRVSDRRRWHRRDS